MSLAPGLTSWIFIIYVYLHNDKPPYIPQQICNYATTQLCNYATMQLCNYARIGTLGTSAHPAPTLDWNSHRRPTNDPDATTKGLLGMT